MILKCLTHYLAIKWQDKSPLYIFNVTMYHIYVAESYIPEHTLQQIKLYNKDTHALQNQLNSPIHLNKSLSCIYSKITYFNSLRTFLKFDLVFKAGTSQLCAGPGLGFSCGNQRNFSIQQMDLLCIKLRQGQTAPVLRNEAK